MASGVLSAVLTLKLTYFMMVEAKGISATVTHIRRPIIRSEAAPLNIYSGFRFKQDG